MRWREYREGLHSRRAQRPVPTYKKASHPCPERNSQVYIYHIYTYRTQAKFILPVTREKCLGTRRDAMNIPFQRIYRGVKKLNCSLNAIADLLITPPKNKNNTTFCLRPNTNNSHYSFCYICTFDIIFFSDDASPFDSYICARLKMYKPPAECGNSTLVNQRPIIPITHFIICLLIASLIFVFSRFK